MDILGVLIEPLAEAWGEEEVSATTLLLVNCFCKIGPDYQYTIPKKSSMSTSKKTRWKMEWIFLRSSTMLELRAAQLLSRLFK